MKIPGKVIIFIVYLCAIQMMGFTQISDFKVQYMLGEKAVMFQENCYRNCDDRIIYINLHDNEQTSRRVADSFLKSGNGKMFHIINDSSRNLDFTVNNKSYTIDPNRIFSKAGRLASLKLLSDNKDEDAEPYVHYLANQVIKNYIHHKSVIVTLHNNSDENFSIKTYLQLNDSLPGSAKVYINNEMDEDDFIITTSLAIFNKIKAKNINVVWENVNKMLDDGSLSLYCSKRKIKYINIEAQHEHFAEQFKMLYDIKDIIEFYTIN